MVDVFKVVHYSVFFFNFRKKKTSKALTAPLEFNRSVSVPVEKGLKTNQVSLDQESCNDNNSSKQRVLKEDR